MTVVYWKWECASLCNGDRAGKSKNPFNRVGVVTPYMYDTAHTGGKAKVEGHVYILLLLVIQ